MSTRIINTRQAGPDHQVVTVEGRKRDAYRREPCSDCPWRKDAAGVFPASAFRHSANTAYDMSQHTFACHQSGSEKPAMCAGFILHGADHNLGFRFAVIRGDVDPRQVSDGGHIMHESYRAMAVANGVSPKAKVLRECRDANVMLPKTRKTP